MKEEDKNIELIKRKNLQSSTLTAIPNVSPVKSVNHPNQENGHISRRSSSGSESNSPESNGSNPSSVSYFSENMSSSFSSIKDSSIGSAESLAIHKPENRLKTSLNLPVKSMSNEPSLSSSFVSHASEVSSVADSKELDTPLTIPVHSRSKPVGSIIIHKSADSKSSDEDQMDTTLRQGKSIFGEESVDSVRSLMSENSMDKT